MGDRMRRDLHLVRHGKAMFNEQRISRGVRCPAHAGGEEQASLIGRYFSLEGIVFDHAYTSTLTRTQQTIERITDMSYERVEDLREWGYGAFEGERVSLMPPSPRGRLFRAFWREAQLDVRRRVRDALAGIMGHVRHGQVLAVRS